MIFCRDNASRTPISLIVLALYQRTILNATCQDNPCGTYHALSVAHMVLDVFKGTFQQGRRHQVLARDIEIF